MDRSTKLYIKAIKYYNEGYIDKAMEYCEKSISENLKNAPAINLKGLLYYIKGELESAQALWKMNYQVNRDMVAKKYLQDSKSDEEKKLLYASAIKLIKELRIREALQLLEKCQESDFNSININNYMALCYIKLGEYDKALNHIKLVKRADRKNKAAANNKKELIALGAAKREWNIKYASIVAAALVSIIILGTFIRNIGGSPIQVSVTDDRNTTAVLTSSLTSSEPADLKKANEKVDEQPEEKKVLETFPFNKVEAALENKEYDNLYDLFFYWKDKEITINQKNLIVKAKEQLSTSGIEFFYNTVREALSTKDYKTAINYLNKSLSFSEGHYLNSHIIYLLAVSYKNTSDIENAINYYKQYDSKYFNGDYEEAVLYELALIYKDIDNNEAKNYAEKLSRLYPKSIYNNSIIKAILTR
jgi:tetratricopeptide (TPR) repeat protein